MLADINILMDQCQVIIFDIFVDKICKQKC